MIPERRLLIAAALCALSSLAAADNHKWEIREIFSSADETVQFIELFNADKDEHTLAGMTLTTASGSLFVFPSNLPSSATENRRLLLATAAFAAIPGAPAPDYVIPAGFLDRTGDTLTYTATPDAVNFGALPVDGVTAITDTGAQVVNSPTNFANASGSVLLATAAVRIGNGTNPQVYSSSPAAFGKLWTASISTVGHPGNPPAFVIIGAHRAGASGPILPYGQLLVDVLTPQVFELVKPAAPGGVTSFDAMVPVNLVLLGRTLATQGVIVGNRIRLTNAVDLKLGW
ncbi:MAG TPA: hypothetical protein VF530_11105 [Planctomycetota bacterium]